MCVCFSAVVFAAHWQGGLVGVGVGRSVADVVWLRVGGGSQLLAGTHRHTHTHR